MAGYVYVTVGGNAVNDGIMLMNGSGGGDTGGSYRLAWTNVGGFTGTGWERAWNSRYVPLKGAWIDHPAEGHDATYSGFLSYVANDAINDLSEWLDHAGWTDAQKYDFANDGDREIWIHCTSF